MKVKDFFMQKAGNDYYYYAFNFEYLNKLVIKIIIHHLPRNIYKLIKSDSQKK